MDRREVLKSGLGTALAACGVSEVKTIDGRNDIELVILKIPERSFLSETGNEAASVLSTWKDFMKGTCLENVKTIVTTGGLEVEVVRRNA